MDGQVVDAVLAAESVVVGVFLESVDEGVEFALVGASRDWGFAARARRG